jgi:hypothetical protein
MPQLFQDLITGDLARFSAMTVIDRSNEQMVIAEQTLSLSGYYSDDDYIRIGNLTNAQFIVVGSIQNVSGRYNISFRINSFETNEIKASFNKPYSINDIESGLAAKEAVLELLFGLGIELTEAGERILLTVQPVEVQAITNLSKGMIAESNNDHVDALAYFFEAVNIAPTMREASERIHNFGSSQIGASIRERANYAQAQIDKWNKIFVDLGAYLDNNLVLAVYDFSIIEDNINIRANTVSITVKPGVKVFPNRTALLVWQRIIDEWYRTVSIEDNRLWVSSVRIGTFGNSAGNTGVGGIGYSCSVEVGLYNSYDERIGNETVSFNASNRGIIRFTGAESYRSNPQLTFQPLAQFRYFEERNFVPVTFSSIPIDRITDTITPRLVTWHFDQMRRIRMSANSPMSVPEWQEWLSLQGGAR